MYEETNPADWFVNPIVVRDGIYGQGIGQSKPKKSRAHTINEHSRLPNEIANIVSEYDDMSEYNSLLNQKKQADYDFIQKNANRLGRNSHPYALQIEDEELRRLRRELNDKLELINAQLRDKFPHLPRDPPGGSAPGMIVGQGLMSSEPKDLNEPEPEPREANTLDELRESSDVHQEINRGIASSLPRDLQGIISDYDDRTPVHHIVSTLIEERQKILDWKNNFRSTHLNPRRNLEISPGVYSWAVDNLNYYDRLLYDKNKEIEKYSKMIEPVFAHETKGSGKGSISSWVSHVKAYQNKHKCTYKQALTRAKSTYKK